MSSTFKIEFERIGRSRSVEPLIVRGDADAIAKAVHKHARAHLRSRYYDVDVDLAAMRGVIICGMYNGGEFRITDTSVDQHTAATSAAPD